MYIYMYVVLLIGLLRCCGNWIGIVSLPKSGVAKVGRRQWIQAPTPICLGHENRQTPRRKFGWYRCRSSRANVAFGQTKRTEIIATRHISWVQNMFKMLSRLDFVPYLAEWVYNAPPELLAEIWNRLAAGKRANRGHNGMSMGGKEGQNGTKR